MLLIIFCGRLLDSLQQLYVCLEVVSPELDTVLQMWPPQGRAEGRRTSLDLMDTFFVMYSEIPLAFLAPEHTAGSWSPCCPPGHSGPSLQSSFPAAQPLTCTDECDYSTLDAGLCTCPCSPSSDSSLTIFSACPGFCLLCGSIAFWCVIHSPSFVS